MVIVVRPEPYTAGPYALSIGVTPETGNFGDAFSFLGILTLSGSPMMGVTVQLVLEGVGVVGEDVTGSMGNYDITWVADQSGTISFHAEAPGIVSSDTISITVEEAPPPPPPGEPFTSVRDFVVPDSLPAGSPVTVSTLLKNTGDTTGLLDVYIDGNPDDPDREVMVETGTTYPTEVAPGGSVWLEITFRYFNMPNWDFNLTARNYDGTSSISKTITLSEVITSAYIPEISYWIDGMPSWGTIWSDPTGPMPVAPPNYSDRPAENGEDIYLSVAWLNTGTVPVTGHVDLELTAPSGARYVLSASSGQDQTNNPNSGSTVGFNPFTLDEAGAWGLKATLSHADGTLDEETTAFSVEEVPTHNLGIGIVDWELSQYVPCTIIVDGTSYDVTTYKTFTLEEGAHTFDLELPADYDWTKWTVHNWVTGEIIAEPTERPLSWNLVEDTFIYGVITSVIVEIPTTLTIIAPDEVEPDETFDIIGQLTRDDTGAAIPDMSINVSYNGTSIGSVLTDMQGVYTIPASIPTAGTYTLKTEFLGTAKYATSKSQADTMVTTPLTTAIKLAGPAIIGLALTIYGTR